MQHIIDTNVLAKANRLDFPFHRGLRFWDWLVDLGNQGFIVIPEKVYEEIGKGTDELPSWLHDNRKSFFCSTQAALFSLQPVLMQYGNPVPENLLEQIGADPYVIAHAHACGGIVISDEVPKAATSPVKKKIPTVCAGLGVECWSFPRFLWELRSISA